ncbi:MAG: hypothetical protein IKH84_07565, partial [Ottowia sp.]|nr:hypothetical protein [Ottowia sp.]
MTTLLVIIAALGYIAAFMFWSKSNQQSKSKPQPQASARPSMNEVHELFDGPHPVMPRTLLR